MKINIFTDNNHYKKIFNIMASNNTKPSQARSPKNGPLKFHDGTEDQLAEYILTHAEKNNPDSVIETGHYFCWNIHWMMNIGDIKGEFLINEMKKHSPKNVLELGSYCCASTIMMAKYLPDGGKVYTIDPVITSCATKLIKHAGLENKIEQLQGKAETVIPTLSELKGKIDMVFIDHDKTKYLSDLLLIEQSGLLHPGSVVVADNVIIFHIDDYLDHVRSDKYSTSTLHLSTLEYDDSNKEEMIDGIEVSIWK